MGADKSPKLDAMVGRGTVLDRLSGFISLMACIMRLMRLANIWIAAAVILWISLDAAVAQPKSDEAPAHPKRIVVLYSYGQQFQAWATWSKAIRSELGRQSSWPLDIQEHSLVTARNGDEAAEGKFVEYLKALYAQQPPDLILCLAAPAARFVQRYRADLFPTAPMLLAVVDLRRVDQSILSGQDAMAGVQFDPVVLIENIQRLLPETKTIAMINGAAPTERFWAGEMKRVLGPLLENKVELLFYGERSLAETQKAVASLPPHSAILFQQLNVDGTGAVYGDKEPLKRLSKVANAPIFTFDESYFDGDVVGGPMFSPADGARSTAAVALRILGGEKASAIKAPPTGFAAPKYDWRQLQRWNITESRLPPGSEVLFRELSAWDRYRWQIVAMFGIIFLQGSTITGLLYEGRRRRFAEAQAKRRLTELAHVNRHLIANELGSSIAHEVNQPLGAILNNAETMKILLGTQSPDLDELREIVDDILRDDRRASEVILRLRNLLTKEPFDLRDIDLNQIVSEVIELLSTTARQRRVKFIKALSSTALPVRGDTVQLQQVLVNLMINGMDAMSDTNGVPREIIVRSASSRGFAEVSVSDTGPGISPDQIGNVFDPFFTTKQNGMGIGLSIAQTIVEAHSGEIWAENQMDGGAVFRIRLQLSVN
jgi:signal transduction histidine kinase